MLEVPFCPLMLSRPGRRLQVLRAPNPSRGQDLWQASLGEMAISFEVWDCGGMGWGR